MNEEQIKETTPWFEILIKAGSVAEGNVLVAIQDQLDAIIELENLFESPSHQ